MKKFLAGLVVLFVLLVSFPVSAEAQTCRSKRYRNSNVSRNYYNRNYNRNYNGYYNRNYRTYYSNQGYVYQQRPSFYQRNRNLINIATGTGAGALIGALVGGKRGALIGAAIGAGGSALYTYKINPKKRRYYRR